MVARKDEEYFSLWNGDKATPERLGFELEEALAQRRAYAQSQLNSSWLNFHSRFVLVELLVSLMFLN